MKKLFGKNLDVVLGFAFAFFGFALLFWVKGSCSGEGCIFGVMIVLFAFLDSMIFSLIALVKGIKNGAF